MYTILLVIHVISCLVLISVILLQAGRGGGLNEAFGAGDVAQSVLGTQAPSILKKTTTVSAIAFLVTSLLLGVLIARRGRSLFEQTKLPAMPLPGDTTSSVELPAASSQEDGVLPQTEDAQPAAAAQ